MAKDNSSKFGFWGCLFIAIILSIITCVSIYDTFFLYKDYHPEQCLVTDVKFPRNYSDKNLWRSCKCGKRCYAYNPVIKLFVNITHQDGNTTNYLLYSFIDNNDYTFFNHSCKNGKYPNYIDVALRNAQYYNHFFIDKTLPCFFKDDNNPILYKYDYLNNSVNTACFIAIGCTSLCSLCILCCNFKSICCCK